MKTESWTALEGIDLANAVFPVSATVDGKNIWIFRLNDGYRGVQEHCPHQKVSLGNAKLISNETMIRCALHGYTFRLKDGSPFNCRSAPIEVYEVRSENNVLLVRPIVEQVN